MRDDRCSGRDVGGVAALTTGFDRALLAAAQFHPLLLGRFGVYQAALLVLIIGCMIAYAAIWRIAAAETVASIAAVVAGASLALLLLDLDYNPSNVIAVANPLEKMLTFADPNTANAASRSRWPRHLLLLDGFGSVLARYTFVLHSSARPTVFLTWLIVPGIVVAWRRGERKSALQALALMLAALAIDMLDVRRGLKSEYFIFTDPLIVLAGAILLDRMRDLRFRKWTCPIAGRCSDCTSRSDRRNRSSTPSSAPARNRSANGTTTTCRCCRCRGVPIRCGRHGLLSGRGITVLVWRKPNGSWREA